MRGLAAFILVFSVWASVVRAEAPGVLGIAVTMAEDEDFFAAMIAAKQAGADAATLSLFWDETMVDGAYAPKMDWATQANSFYPTARFRLAQTLPVIDTVADRRPADLRGLAWDDPAVLAGFADYATAVIGRLDRVDLTHIAIGNEVDGLLATPDDWAGYGRFYAAAVKVVKGLRPDVPVGVTMTWPGLNGPNAAQAQALAAQGDIWLITHYSLDAGFHIRPPDEIAATLDAMIAMAAGKPVFLAEVGYPSDGCETDEAGQLAFFQGLFAAWDSRAADIPLMSLVWLHDLSPTAVGELQGYYGVGDDCFGRYLGSIGLRSHAGADKPAFAWLRAR